MGTDVDGYRTWWHGRELLDCCKNTWFVYTSLHSASVDGQKILIRMCKKNFLFEWNLISGMLSRQINEACVRQHSFLLQLIFWQRVWYVQSQYKAFKNQWEVLSVLACLMHVLCMHVFFISVPFLCLSFWLNFDLKSQTVERCAETYQDQ